MNAREASAPRLVFAGITGVEKNKVASKFRRFIANKLRVPADHHSIPIFWAEGANSNMHEFLGLEPSTQNRSLCVNYDGVVRGVEGAATAASTRAIVILLHHTFMDTDRILSSLSWIPNKRFDQWMGPDSTSLMLDFLRAVQPTHIINLVDDVHYIQNRLKRRQMPSALGLRDLLKWRELEILIADHAANEVIKSGNEDREFHRFERSPVFAIRHKCDALYKYVFRPATPRVYASFLISEIRRPSTPPNRRKSMSRQVNQLVMKLSEQFCVFNPLTIDEKPLENLLGAKARAKSDIIASTAKADRWRISTSSTLASDPVQTLKGLSLSDITAICTKHAKDDRTVVDRQVTARDYRLIDQSDCVVIYRPTNKLNPKETGVWGGGCQMEFMYAFGEMRIRPNLRICFIVDETDPEVENLITADSGAFKRVEGRIKIFRVKGLDERSNLDKAIAEVANFISTHSSELTSARASKAPAEAH